MGLSFVTDHNVARRLERAEAAANARFVEARARISPESGARWIEVAGAYAMFDGVRSPCTQTFGLGIFQAPTPADMEKIEGFFRERSAPVFHEVCPHADKSLLPLLNERGYRPIELSNVLLMPLLTKSTEASVSSNPLQVRVVHEGERELWARTATEGWREFTEFADLMYELMRVSASTDGSVDFLAYLDGQPIAAGGLAIHEGVAILAGASTIPEWRRRGAQQALLESRLQYALQAGCDLAMVVAEPGGPTQRNAERRGFRVAYTRTKWKSGS
ncbi:MAG: GNAT family N-acetyltransferase [Terriglobia bacterium]